MKTSQKTHWLRGGLIGVIICIALGFFYIFAYFPTVDKYRDEEGIAPAWTQTLPTITGHFLPLYSSFIVPYGFLCEFSETTCTQWAADEIPGSTPWTLDGQAGYCIAETPIPTSRCAAISETVGFFALSFLLLAIYFFIGAFIGKICAKKSP